MSKTAQCPNCGKAGSPIFEGSQLEKTMAAMSTSPSAGTCPLRGTISGYRKKREMKDLLIPSADRGATGAAAILAALAGQGGAAVAGMNATNVREESDFVEFELNGEPVKGWLTYSPFKEGDHVEILAVREESEWNAFGILRDDYVVALHPCCSRGRHAHFKASMRWWLIISTIMLIAGSVVLALVVSFDDGYRTLADPSLWALFLGGSGGGFFLIGGLLAANQSRNFMPAVRLTESIFARFGWKNVKSIDLPAITKKNTAFPMKASRLACCISVAGRIPSMNASLVDSDIVRSRIVSEQNRRFDRSTERQKSSDHEIRPTSTSPMSDKHSKAKSLR
jgi:hypothetical protein